jgi:hypothetical protein
MSIIHAGTQTLFFFGIEATTSETTQESHNSYKTIFYNGSNQVGSSTTQWISDKKISSIYYDLNNKIGSSTTEWKTDKELSTIYYDNYNTLGNSRTQWTSDTTLSTTYYISTRFYVGTSTTGCKYQGCYQTIYKLAALNSSNEESLSYDDTLSSTKSYTSPIYTPSKLKENRHPLYHTPPRSLPAMQKSNIPDSNCNPIFYTADKLNSPSKRALASGGCIGFFSGIGAGVGVKLSSASVNPIIVGSSVGIGACVCGALICCCICHSNFDCDENSNLPGYSKI